MSTKPAEKAPEKTSGEKNYEAVCEWKDRIDRHLQMNGNAKIKYIELDSQDLICQLTEKSKEFPTLTRDTYYTVEIQT
jgi:hypothetical protein